MSKVIDALLSGGPVVTDGAWGTPLLQRGLASGDCPDHWNLTHPELVAEVPRAYVDAGSKIVLTNTFRANRIALADYVCNKVRSATSLPIWIKANAGIPEVDDGKVIYRTDANEFGSYAAALVNAGAQFIGGCCGTGPEYIRALVANLNAAGY